MLVILTRSASLCRDPFSQKRTWTKDTQVNTDLQPYCLPVSFVWSVFRSITWRQLSQVRPHLFGQFPPETIEFVYDNYSTMHLCRSKVKVFHIVRDWAHWHTVYSSAHRELLLLLSLHEVLSSSRFKSSICWSSDSIGPYLKGEGRKKSSMLSATVGPQAVQPTFFKLLSDTVSDNQQYHQQLAVRSTWIRTLSESVFIGRLFMTRTQDRQTRHENVKQMVRE